MEELEKSLDASRSVAVFVGPGEMRPWQKREVAYAIDRQARDPQFPVIPVLLPGCDPPLGFLSQLTWIDLRQPAAKSSQIDRLARIIQGGSAAGEDQRNPRSIACPYRGLLSFREEDASFYFGRELYIGQLEEKLARNNLVAVVGASGSGKSSLVQAGLVPRLRRAGRTLVWEIATMRPGVDPFHALADVILPLIEPQLAGINLVERRTELTEKMRTGKTPLWDLTSEALRQQRGTDRLLLVVDQWEELYVECKDESLTARFIKELIDSTSRPSTALSVIFTVREDFYKHILNHRALLDRLRDARVDLGPMNESERREAIERPAKAIRFAFESGLVERLLADAGHEPGNLPLLEFALEELWKRHEADRMTHAAYDAFGRLSGALATRAEQVYESLDKSAKEAAPSLFRRLVNAGAKSEEDARRRAEINSLDEPAQRVVRHMADRRLLVTSASIREGGEFADVVEVAHEELLRNWDRLKQWVELDRRFLQWRRRLESSLNLYQTDPESAFLRHNALQEAREFFNQRKTELEHREREFIAASLRANKRRILRKVAAFLVPTVVVCFTLWLSWRQIERQREREMVKAAIANLPLAPPSSVPSLLNQLAAVPSVATRELNSQYYSANASHSQRIRLAFGLCAVDAVTGSDHEVAAFLVDRIVDVPEEERANLLRALSRLPDREIVKQRLWQRVERADPIIATRYRLAALFLGEFSVVDALRSPSGDPTARTRFIAEFAHWPIEWGELSRRLARVEDDDIRSGLCLALGGVELPADSGPETHRLQSQLVDWWQDTADSGTHSAAGWALRQWKRPPPETAPRLADSHATERRTWYVNRLGMTMVKIPQGSYRLGSRSAPENPPHVAEIREFWIGDCEVTIEQFRKFRSASGVATVGELPSDLTTLNGPPHPVVNVSWFEAVEFCNWLSELEGLTPYYTLSRPLSSAGTAGEYDQSVTPAGGIGYRLPMDAEWECACRGGTVTEYSFGNSDDDLSDYGWFGIEKKETRPIAMLRPNRWGLHDIHGNVWEWCEDWASEDVSRVYRGGSWHYPAEYCRSSYRGGGGPESRLPYVGFRVARSHSETTGAGNETRSTPLSHPVPKRTRPPKNGR
jgi:formylglycine-generating enzyme required for sulfatase activity/ABC-type dipeptide/oligopeptide/nickel transport system ATPase component